MYGSYDRARPIDPERLRDFTDELQGRVDDLERMLREADERIASLEQRRLTVSDLPFAAIIRKLENSGSLDAALLLQPGSVARALARDNQL